ncbi:hypothetical protein [Micromonospora sp. CPCC 205547]|uniref:hypothetical protein n=1 Tax=Micromonospora sp. CPCC 205547 TaxID=3122400 RepID=UPI003B9681D5
MTAALAPAAALDAADWQARRAAHEARVDAWLAPHLARRKVGGKHPVEDLRMRNSGTFRRPGVCKRREADNKGPNR